MLNIWHILLSISRRVFRDWEGDGNGRLRPSSPLSPSHDPLMSEHAPGQPGSEVSADGSEEDASTDDGEQKSASETGPLSNARAALRAMLFPEAREE